MTSADLSMYSKYFPTWGSGLTDINTIFTISANSQQTSVFKELFPAATIKNWSRDVWDLNERNSESCDLLFAGNVFHYSNDPAVWFDNCMQCTEVFWIQDLINRSRDYTQLGGDGDTMRYSLLPHVESDQADAFDLSQLKGIKKFYTYDDENENGPAKHFIMELRK